MAQQQQKSTRKPRVWRITAAALQGEYVELDGTGGVTSSPSARHEGGWVESSLHLAQGLEVKEMERPDLYLPPRALPFTHKGINPKSIPVATGLCKEIAVPNSLAT